MKITFNHAYGQINNYTNLNKKVSEQRGQNHSVETSVPEDIASSSLSLAHFPNITFRMNQDMKFLLAQSDKLKCAYSRMPMISPNEAKTICQKLTKRPNAQSAVNYLEHCEKYMHSIEAKIFDIFKETPKKGKKTFQDILKELQPESLVRLKEQQLTILTSTDKYIEQMSEPVAEKVRAARDEAITRMENDTFGRKALLEQLKKIKAEGRDLVNVIKVYQAWYKLPRSTNNIDAFIVQYSKEPHESIARRLISTAVATVEHVHPSSCGGDDDLSNYLLVSAQFNNERDTMPLDEYIMLNEEIDIKNNLQKYIDDVVREVQDKKSSFSEKSWYPASIVETINRQGNGALEVNCESLRYTKQQMKENNSHHKLAKRYTLRYK